MDGNVFLIINFKLFSVRELDSLKRGKKKKVVWVRFFSCNDFLNILMINWGDSIFIFYVL